MPSYRETLRNLSERRYFMIIYAKGKNIPTFPFSRLLTKGEKLSDTVTFVLDRYHNGIDLSACSFLIRGVNSQSQEAQQALLPEVQNEKIHLSWNISEYFTAADGRLELELRASKTADDKAQQEEVIVKYTMAPVFVKPSPNGENQALPDTAEQAVTEIAAAAAAGLESIRTEVSSLNLDEVDKRLSEMDAKIDIFLARPEVIPVTKSEYSTITHKPDALYVIVED